MNNLHESEDARRDELRRMPEGMLDSIANSIVTKMRAGGKVSPSEKRLASRAKTELRRRRDNMNDKKESYEAVFDRVMKEYGVETIAELNEEQTSEFFHTVDTIYTSQGEN